jgi:hypothetical protein
VSLAAVSNSWLLKKRGNRIMQNKAFEETLTILSGQTTSQALNLLEAGREVPHSVAIYGPASLTGTVTVEVSPDGGATWNVLHSAGVAVEVAAASCVVILAALALFEQIRVKSDGAEGADRVFALIAAELVEL